MTSDHADGVLADALVGLVRVHCVRVGAVFSTGSAFLSSCSELRGPPDALDRPAGTLRSAKRVRRSRKCVPRAAQGILSDVAGALVTSDHADGVVEDALVCLVRVQ